MYILYFKIGGHFPNFLFLDVKEEDKSKDNSGENRYQRVSCNFFSSNFYML